jgi:iron(III) transport system substrate-binding protein
MFTCGFLIREDVMHARRLTLAALAAAGLALACNAARAEDSQRSLYEAGKQDGKVVVWTSLETGLYKKIAAKFAQRYPGIEIEPFRIQPGPAIERLVTEAKARRINVDVLDANIAYLPILLERGFLEPYPWDGVFGIDAQRLLFDKRALLLGHYDLPIGYNTALVGPNDIASWDDLTEPKWRGKLLLEARGFGLGILAAKWGEERTLAYIKKLLDNRPILMKGAQGTAEALAGGQGALAIGAYAARLTLFKEAGAPVDWVRVGPIPAQQVAVAPVKGGPHSAAAKLLAAFWTTAEAQDIFYEDQRYGMVGYYQSPRGEELRQRGIEVVLETTDIEKDKSLLEMVARAIGGMK